MTSNHSSGGRRERAPQEGRDQLLALVSHELRTPLTVIGSASRVLGTDPKVVQDPVLAGVVEDLLTASRRMERVVANMLLLADQDGNSVPNEPFLVRIAVGEAIGVLAGEFPGARVELVPGSDPGVAADGVPSWTVLILLNLLNNAYLYGDRGRPIFVQWHTRAEAVEIQVCNSGEATGAESMERWFEPFFRVRARDQAHGAGLGLTVARNLARTQGGDLTAQPWENQSGTMMTFTLPIAFEKVPEAAS